MSEPRTFTGGCHCGAVRYRVTLALEGAIACNCSICQKTGTVLAFAPAEQFELLSGGDALGDYQFGKRRIHHLFCTRCGVRSFTRGPTKVSINVRCLDGVDLKSIPTKEFDGKSLPLE